MMFKALVNFITFTFFPPKKEDFVKRVPYTPEYLFPFTGVFANNEEQFTETKIGYCFPWALAISNRRQGLVSGSVTASEWVQLKSDSRVLSSGATGWSSILRYFIEREKKIEILSVDLDGVHASYYAAQQMKKGAQVFLTLAINKDKIDYGHIECVLAISKDSIITNSWGERADCLVYPYLKHPLQTTFNEPEAEIHLIIVK